MESKYYISKSIDNNSMENSTTNINNNNNNNQQNQNNSNNSNNNNINSNNNNNNNSNNSNNKSQQKNIKNNNYRHHKKYNYINEEDKPLFYNYDLRKRNRLTFYLIDWLCVVIVLVIGGILFLKVKVRGRLFRLDDPDIAYPLLDELVPMHSLIPIIIIVPLGMMVLVSLLIKRNRNDFHHAILGLAQAITLTLLLVASFKTFIGGLRPNFLSICKPTPQTIAAATPVGYGGIYYDSSICTATESEVNDALSAYPSGHAAISATSLGYLALYLNSKFKTFDGRGHLFLYISVCGCTIGAGLIGVSRIADYRHTFLNVLAGWIIGIFIAFSMYRLNYLSVFGNDNHVPISKHWKHLWNHQESFSNGEYDCSDISNNDVISLDGDGCDNTLRSPNGVPLKEIRN